MPPNRDILKRTHPVRGTPDRPDQVTEADRTNMRTAQILSGCIAVLLAWPTSTSAAETILTPKPGPAPHINGPKVYGCHPAHPFLYRIPTTGQRPIRFAAEGLPPSLEAEPGHWHHPRHSATARRVPACLASREPARQGRADAEDRLRRHAGANASDGLEPLVRPLYADHRTPDPPGGRRHGCQRHGRRGIPICQHRRLLAKRLSHAKHNDDPLRVAALRDAQGNILPNRYFPDMRALVDYIHSKGLKAGIYTSPGPLDCAGFTGSYQHEAQDARQFRRLGVRPAQVRLVLLWPDCRPRQEPRGPAEALQADGRTAQGSNTGTSSTTSASTAWATSGSGGRRSAATVGAPRATWALN